MSDFNEEIFSHLIAQQYHLDRITDLVGLNTNLLERMPGSFTKTSFIPTVDIIYVFYAKKPVDQRQLTDILKETAKQLNAKSFDDYDELLTASRKFLDWLIKYAESNK